MSCDTQMITHNIWHVILTAKWTICHMTFILHYLKKNCQLFKRKVAKLPVKILACITQDKYTPYIYCTICYTVYKKDIKVFKSCFPILVFLLSIKTLKNPTQSKWNTAIISNITCLFHTVIGKMTGFRKWISFSVSLLSWFKHRCIFFLLIGIFFCIVIAVHCQQGGLPSSLLSIDIK